MKRALGILLVFVTLPISFYLQYQILKRVEATELMWFLFWINVPVHLLIASLTRLLESSK